MTDFWVGTTVGAIVAILAAEPAGRTLQTLMSPDIRIEQLNKEIAKREVTIDELRKSMAVLPQANLIRRVEVQRDQLDAEKVAAKQCHERVLDLEFQLDGTRSAVPPGDVCLRELASIKGVKLREGEGSRQVGGRLYFGASMVAFQPTNPFCKLRWSTDLAAPPNRSNEMLLNPGEKVMLDSTVGIFHLALTKVGKDEGGNFCLLDLVRAR